VLYVVHSDTAGSFFDWARAVNRHTQCAVRVATFNRHPFGFEHDLLFPNPRYVDSGLDVLISEANLLHVKDEKGFFDGSNELPPELFLDCPVPKVFTQFGGFSRKLGRDPAYRVFTRRFEGRVAITPDLCYPWYEGRFIPHAMDVKSVPYCWRPGRVIAHSPSQMQRKGTAAFAEAVAALGGQSFNLDIITGVDHRTAVRRKQEATLFFDQSGRENPDVLGIDEVIGWYGKSAVEAMAAGIPTLAHLSKQALEQSGFTETERAALPVINVPLDAAGMRGVLDELSRKSETELRELSGKTRAWAEAFHSDEAVGPKLAALYDELLKP
jgi:hypothetical protein